MKSLINWNGARNRVVIMGLAATIALGIVAGPGGPGGGGVAMAQQVGASDAKAAEIAAIYKGAADGISKVLSDSLGSLDSTGVASASYRAGRAAALLEEIRGITRRANLKGVTVVSPAVEESFKRGSALAAEQAKELGLGGRVTQTETSFAGINEQTVDAIARDSVAKMARGTAQHGEQAVSLFRSLSTSMAAIDGKGVLRGFSLSERDVNRVIAQGIVSGDPREAMGLMRSLIGKGAGFDKGVVENYRKVGNQLIGVGDWSGTVRTYAEIVVRTRTADAQAEGQIERQVSVGLDLGQITGSNSLNFCTNFNGMVVVVRGPARDGYIAISDLPGGKVTMHPQCTKTITAYAPDLVSERRVEQAARAQVVYERKLANGSLLDRLPAVRRAA